MDYRDTEDFARRMEQVQLRAGELRREAQAAFWKDVAVRLHRAFTAVRGYWTKERTTHVLPEA
jgi:hypothetical protein